MNTAKPIDISEELFELENVAIECKAVSDLLNILADCALEGATTLNNYGEGINLISTLANKNTVKLQAICDKIFSTPNRTATTKIQ